MKNFLKKIIISILTLEARIVLRKYKPKIVAITGSVGKTSAKDAIYAVMNPTFFVRKSDKSFNSDIGLPLTILGVPNGWSNIFIWFKNIIEGFMLIVLRNHYPKWLILEIGADRPGDIENISKWLKPDIVVVTRLPKVPAHIEFFDSPDAIIREKEYLVKSLKDDGALVLNGDDDTVFGLRQSASENNIVSTFGFSDNASFRASNDSIIYEDQMPVGMMFRADYSGKSIPISIKGALGRQSIYSALAALAVGVSQNLNTVSMGQALEKYNTAPGRMKLLKGIRDSLIIDDSYNSSPVAAEEALNILKETEAKGKKIAVLGDMMELGEHSMEEHKRIGRAAVSSADKLITVGVRARYIAEGALIEGMSEKDILQFDDAKRAGKELEHILSGGDVVLIKGSQSIRIERTVEEVMLHPEKKKELLVRQEKEWQRK